MLIAIAYADRQAIILDMITNATDSRHNLENAANGVGFYVNASITEFKSFNKHVSLRTVNVRLINKICR